AGSIFAGSATSSECAGGPTDDGYNIDDDGSCVSSTNPGPGSISNSAGLDASLGTLADNGGPTQTILPGATSPAANRIPASTPVGGTTLCAGTDQRGIPRPSGETACAMGSVEVEPGSAPAITSGSATSFAIGVASTFTVRTTGAPAPYLTESGALPAGMTFTDNGDGTATLAGTPASGTVGTYPLSLTASNYLAPAGTQAFTVTVSPPALPPPVAGFTPSGPTRVLDTRVGLGAPEGPVGPGQTITLTVPNLPAGTTAVVLNLTGTGLSGAPSTFVSACPAAQALSACEGTSALNATPGVDVANEIIVPVGPDGKITLYNNAGSINLVADVAGFLSGGFVPAGPTRILDTRTAPRAPRTALGPRGTITLTVPNLPAGTTAVVLNLTGTNLTGAGATFVSACPAADSLQACTGTSALNVVAGQTVANEITVPVGPDGKILLYNNAGSLNLVADLTGYVTGGYAATGPTRILDTRTGLGAPQSPVGPAAALTLAVPGLPAGTKAVVLNLTGTRLTGAPGSYLSACPAAEALSACTATSVLNVVSGVDAANAITVPVGPDGKVTLYNNAGSIDLVADLAGFYTG
ncbi:MAG: choice-of-anchor Q domain-containing protein, partial [Mycobacteriales bacterium]